MDPTSTERDALDRAGRALAEGWAASDFASLLPLHVGGDLEPVEAAAVRAWLAQHPESQADLDAAVAARRALLDGAAARHADHVDLWPGVRAALVAEGWIGRPMAPARVNGPSGPLAPESLVRSDAGRARAPRAHLRRVLASAGAAAAALAFTTGLAHLLGFIGGSPELVPLAGSAAPGRPAAPMGPVAHVVDAPREGEQARGPVGGAPDVRLVAHPELPAGVVRLGVASGPLLEQHAVEVDLGNYYPGASFPIGRPAPSSTSLVGGLEDPLRGLVGPPGRR